MHSISTRPTRFSRLGTCLAAAALAVAGCTGADGKDGTNGQNGNDGTDGQNGQNGNDGTDGQNGQNGNNGNNGNDATSAIDPSTPLSGVVALALQNNDGTGATTIPQFVKARVQAFATGTLSPLVQFPLSAAATDSVRTLFGLHGNVVVKWLDPLTWREDLFAPRFGANNDYVAYFGDGWNADWGADGTLGSAPQFAGSGSSGWMWVNHEYVSGTIARTTAAPTGQQLVLARWMKYFGLLANNVTAGVWKQGDVDAVIDQARKQVGGTWMRIVQDPATLEWQVDRSSNNLRYDATGSTLVKIVGVTPLSGLDHTDSGTPLPPGVVTGMTGNCAGGTSPWGTILSAEENAQDYYGDLELAWDSNQKFITGMGFDPGSVMAPNFSATSTGEWGHASNTNALHARDLYNYVTEIDPGVAANEYADKTTPGVGHKKLGYFGRARWEGASFQVGPGWELIPGKPVVFYSGEDRRGGRVYKWVSNQPYTVGMTRAQVRTLLDDGKLYVAHFAGLDNKTGDTMLDGSTVENEPGDWLELSTESTDVAPNAAAAGAPGKTIGAALKDMNYNRIGSIPDDAHMLMALFTAANKVGVMELNRPEDVEWNANDPSGTPTLYIAFTNHGRKAALDQNGLVFDPATHAMNSPTRPDKVGSLFALREVGDPATSTGFTFTKVWAGTKGTGRFDAADIDNVMIDSVGGVWFGTDGNFGTAGHADALYYLDLDPAHKTTLVPTFGKAFRIASAPSDAEFTGPAFTSDERTLFFAVQHPGEAAASTWPQR